MESSGKIAVTGASGFVGRALCLRLRGLGYEVVALRSRHAGPGGFDADTGYVDLAALQGARAIVHLAGEPIAQRWSEAAKGRILASRRDGTRALARAAAALDRRPEAFIAMSGINRYGTRRVEPCDESSSPRTDSFLAEVTAAWEEAAVPAAEAGIRTVFLRTGMVLAPEGGALKKMLPAFRLGLGGPIGGGRQRVSWIALPDLVELIVWSLRTPAIAGPLNAVAPRPATQGEFARALGAALGRPAFLPLPSWVISLLFGQMGRETVLGDLEVRPQVALSHGFRFAAADLPAAFRLVLRG